MPEKTVEELVAELSSRLQRAEEVVNSVATKQKDAEMKAANAAKEEELRAKLEEEFKAKYHIGEESKDVKKDEAVVKEDAVAEDKKKEETSQETDTKTEETKTNPNVGTVASKQSMGEVKTYKTVADIIAAAHQRM